MKNSSFMKYVEEGHFAKDLERTAEQVRAEKKEFSLPPSGLSKDGKRVLPRERPEQPRSRPERQRTA
jgi:hypothetical protein